MGRDVRHGDRPTTTRHPDGTLVTNVYDAWSGELTKVVVTGPAPATEEYEYNEYGEIERAVSRNATGTIMTPDVQIQLAGTDRRTET